MAANDSTKKSSGFRNCVFTQHENIEMLYHVEPVPIEDLPSVCTCGRPLTYAPTVMFATFVDDLSPTDDSSPIKVHPFARSQISRDPSKDYMHKRG